jgi:hypothetical protein
MNRVSRGLLAVFLSLGATTAWAQATAQINGRVVDSSGAVLPGVTIASGWRLAGIFRAQSGYALTVSTGGDRALDGMQYQRVNQVSDNPYGAKTVDNWLNPQAFAQPALGTHGATGRNAYTGMGTRVVDLALVRSFRFANTRRLEARIEAFNAFNWFRPLPPDVNPNNNQSPVTNLANPNFGRYQLAGDPRVMQFALKYSF